MFLTIMLRVELSTSFSFICSETLKIYKVISAFNISYLTRDLYLQTLIDLLLLIDLNRNLVGLWEFFDSLFDSALNEKFNLFTLFEISKKPKNLLPPKSVSLSQKCRFCLLEFSSHGTKLMAIVAQSLAASWAHHVC